MIIMICTRCKRVKTDDSLKTCFDCRVKSNNQSKKRRKECKAKNKCLDCGNQSEYSRCKQCLASRSRKKLERVKSGLCANCVNKVDNGHSLCEKCRQNKKNKRNEKRNNGICISCFNKRIKEGCSSYCSSCLDWHKNLKLTRKSEGLCIICGDKAIEHTSKCEKCYLRTTSRKHFGDSKYYTDLREIFVKQNELCPYSGIKLHLGVNADLDHVVPKYLGGNKSIQNVQWVLNSVNKMKWSHCEDDFLILVKKVYEYRNLEAINEKD